jgi:hypothetical protein
MFDMKMFARVLFKGMLQENKKQIGERKYIPSISLYFPYNTPYQQNLSKVRWRIKIIVVSASLSHNPKAKNRITGLEIRINILIIAQTGKKSKCPLLCKRYNIIE